MEILKKKQLNLQQCDFEYAAKYNAHGKSKMNNSKRHRRSFHGGMGLKEWQFGPSEIVNI